MTLGKKQELFTYCWALLILEAHRLGFQCRSGDTFRDPRSHGAYGTKKGYSARYSLHKLKLAGDLLLFKDGRYLTAGKHYGDLGAYWLGLGEVYGVEFEWGGKPGRSDANHFSIKHHGRW